MVIYSHTAFPSVSRLTRFRKLTRSLVYLLMKTRGSINFANSFFSDLEFVRFLGGDQPNCAEDKIEYSTGFYVTM